MRLEHLVSAHAAAAPTTPAVHADGKTLSYAALNEQAEKAAAYLREREVKPGDRVGIWLPKSAFAIVVMQALLRLGAVYVPLDPLAPEHRINTIANNCALAAMIVDAAKKRSLASPQLPVHSDEDIRAAIAGQTRGPTLPRIEDDSALAYILHTSGSTGTPKGICITHRNALAFVKWAAKATDVSAEDRFANHAPFHFDLSVFDIYAAFLCGAVVCLLLDEQAGSPAKLIDFLNSVRPTVWYSVPSTLMLMMDHGNLCHRECHQPRALIFAGEPFPQHALLMLFSHWRGTRFFNFFGPTETNVCLAHEVRSGDFVHRHVPIGRACSGDSVWLEDEHGSMSPAGDVGEIVVRGPTVMQGYWDEPPVGDIYRTGDLAFTDSEGNYHFVGRRDSRVKLRGRRIELGEIEAVLEAHDAISQAAVVVTGSALEATLHAVVTSRGGHLSLLSVKRHICQHLPHYMAPDTLKIVGQIPRTRNGKIDRNALKHLPGDRVSA